MVEHTPLEEVFIFFGTATYDEIERDVKVNQTLCLKLLSKKIVNNINLCRGTQK